ncbi:MAG: ADP-ribosylglycohydrolase family protein [Bacteroidota bacterium]
MKRFIFSICILFGLLSSCRFPDDQPSIMAVKPDSLTLATLPYVQMSRDALYDKVLGALVGSAIGDAMGAPTEMWSRNSIQVEYGFVQNLDDMVREASPEGTWEMNLQAGGTTDDTRWKYLTGLYMLEEFSSLYREKGPNPRHFAKHITDQYEKEVNDLLGTNTFDPKPIEERVRRMAWLQEWAVVAKPYVDKDMDRYMNALHRFYGGEMVCAGLLYSPMFGIPYPGQPEKAYETAYQLSIFDLGYARDITALTSAMMAEAMMPDATQQSVLAVLSEVDPQGYFESRLVGRSSYKIWRDVRYLVSKAKVDSSEGVTRGAAPGERDAMQKAFELLDQRNQDYPFHAGEIHMINLAALLFSNFDFQTALAFVTNYGRDNDTVGAVTGAILGAFHGYENLPEDMKTQVLTINKQKLGIDLEKLATDLTRGMMEAGAISTTNQ